MSTHLKTIFSVTVIGLMARLVSLISVQLYMAFYGPLDVALNIYSFALYIPNTVFSVLWTAIIAIVVPIYSGLLAKKEEAQAKAFLNDMITIIALAMVAFIGLGILVAPLIAGFTQYRHVAADFEFLVFALRVMFLVVFFYGLQYIFQGFLHSHGKVRLPAFVAVPSGLIIIAYVVFLGDTFGVTGLLFATVLGLSTQAFLLLPAAIKNGLRYKPSLNFKSPEVRRAGLLFVPILVSGLSFQANMIFNASLATYFNAVTILNFVQNLILVIILTIVYSITAVFLPKLSGLWAVEDKVGFGNTLRSIIMLIIFLLLPATAGLFMLRFEIIHFLVQWGNFDLASAQIAATMLGFYSLGIIAIGFKEILDRAFYAQKNSKFPALFTFVIMVVNVIFCLTFIGRLGVFTMAIGFPISTTVGVIGLLIIQNKRVGVFNQQVLQTAAKVLGATVIMVGALYLALPVLRSVHLPGEVLTRAFMLFVPTLGGILVYFVCAYFLGISQVRDVMQAIKNKMRMGQK